MQPIDKIDYLPLRHVKNVSKETWNNGGRFTAEEITEPLLKLQHFRKCAP